MSSEKTEKPTPRRRKRAREEGQVARSADLSGAVALLAGAGALSLFLPGMGRTILDFARRAWRLELAPASGLLDGARSLLLTTAPVVGVFVLAGVATGVAQVGLRITPRVLRPDASRLDPVAGFKRLFSFARLGVVLRASVAFALAAAAARHFGEAGLRSCFRALARPGLVWLRAVSPTLLGTLVFTGAALLVPGAIDWALARRRLTRQLMMSRKEIEDEHKSQEGDPQHKAQRRQAHREMALTPARPLAQAKVVVVNPTHLAVALHHGETIEVPEVGVRGAGEAAAAIRSEARRLGIPIVRDVPLARALVRLPPGSPIPEDLYEPVAAVLAAIYRARARVGRRP